MKKLLSLLSAIVIINSAFIYADTGKLYDYQNYNHGYCPECSCEPCECGAQQQSPCPPTCDPCAAACGAECGISTCAIGVAVAALAAAGAIIISSGNGSTGHAH